MGRALWRADQADTGTMKEGVGKWGALLVEGG